MEKHKIKKVTFLGLGTSSNAHANDNYLPVNWEIEVINGNTSKSGNMIKFKFIGQNWLNTTEIFTAETYTSPIPPDKPIPSRRYLELQVASSTYPALFWFKTRTILKKSFFK